MKHLVSAVLLFLGLFAATAAEADCTATYPSPVTVCGQAGYITSTVHIPGGNYASPYVIASPNTEYILDGDVSADGTAFAIRASKIVLNLNGKTVTYNQSVPGEGVFIDTYNKADIAITNGALIQGAAMSEGDQYGKGNNPVRSLGSSRLQVSHISGRYGGRDVSGIHAQYVSNSLIEENILEDTWTVGTLKNRHQGIDAIQLMDSNNVVRNNAIVNARQRGIQVGNDSEVYGNTISVNSLATNSYGVFAYAKQNLKIHHNTITARGEHPIGIGAVSGGTDNIEIYNNMIDSQTTRIGEEYGGSASCFNPATPCGNYAVGFRTTWGGNNINFYDNTITVRSDSAYQGTYSPTGAPVVVNGKGRGLMVAVSSGESSRFSNNSITALDKDGTGKAFGIACTGGNLGEMVFDGNTVTSNILNVALSDEYGLCAGHPLLVKNTFIKADNYPAYRTIGAGLSGYFKGTGRLVSNAYQGGAAEDSLDMHFEALTGESDKAKSVIFGRLMKGTVRDGSGVPVPGAMLTVKNAGGTAEDSRTANGQGETQFLVYDYELHNSGGTTGNAAPIRADFSPHTIELAGLFNTAPDATAGAWDALASGGMHSLAGPGGSLEINTDGGAYAPPYADIMPPANPAGLSVQ